MKTQLYTSHLILILFLWSSTIGFTQSVNPSRVITPVGFDKSQRLDQIKADPPGYRDRSWKDNVIPNKDGFREEFKKPAPWTGPDPVLQDWMSSNRSSVTIGENFPGMPNLSGYAPPDTDGDVGPNHYMQMVNCTYQIFDKNGNSLVGPYDNITLWDGFTGPWSSTNDGDPIIVYDEYADRWIASQFSLPNKYSGPFYELIAISETGDPTGSWYRYAYEFNNMPDYPKFGVWHDGYYFTINQFTPNSLSFAGGAVCVIDRNAMISGNPNASMVIFTTTYGSLLPADADGTILPPSGSPSYAMSLENTYLRIWEIEMDWGNPSSSSMTNIHNLTVQPFSWSGINTFQPGTSVELDQLATRLMYRLQYRNFGTYEVMLTNHTVNADGNGQGGVRWYELRKSGGGWSIYQQGTFAPSDGDSRWMGSVAMNGNGDIGIGYSVTSSSTYPSIRFAGQTAANSGTGILDITETSIKEGTASQTGPDRWGDYSSMTVDPSDDETFWFTTEYSNGGWSWRTQIASFSFAPPVIVTPIADFSGTPTDPMEGQTVSFTDLSQNNPTSWSWSFPGGVPSTSTDKNPVVTYPGVGTFDVSLTASNAAGSDFEAKTAYITVDPYNLTYCNSSGSNTNSEWIETFSLGSNSFNSSNNGGYWDNTASPISVESSQTYDLTLTPGFSNRPRKQFWRVWVDYNLDGDFTDAGEQVFAANNKRNTVNGTFTLAANLNGEYRMRVSMKYNSSSTSCEQFTYGEVEDYTLLIGTPVPQAPIADFSGSPTSVEVGNSVLFSDESLNTPTSWAWTFTGGTPASSSNQNPTITYDLEGTYSVSLTATNGEGSDTKTISGYITVTTSGGTSDYCTSQSNSNDRDWIGQVDIGPNFTKSSGASLYSDFTSTIIELNPGSTYGVILTPFYPGKTQRDFWRIWIDFDGNGSFEDAGEQVFTANNKRGTVNGNITIPSGVSGPTRMRITMKNGGAPSACEDPFSYGEVEDYTVDFGGALARIVNREELDLKLYPNPATNLLNIEISGTDKTVNLKVYNALGVILDEFNEDSKKITLDLGVFSKGIYYIGADNGQQNTLKKFIKK